uniref:Acetyltransferase n=1 Tax=Parascaris univalens TaxID=6257 RepID=A0A915BNS7_PARUN
MAQTLPVNFHFPLFPRNFMDTSPTFFQADFPSVLTIPPISPSLSVPLPSLYDSLVPHL